MTLSKIIVTAGMVAALAVPAAATAASDGMIIPHSATIGEPIVVTATQPGGKTSHGNGSTKGAKRTKNLKAVTGATTKAGKGSYGAKSPKGANRNKSTKGTTGKGRRPARPSIIIPVPYTPASIPQGSQNGGIDTCQAYGVDCTDRQLCDVWGMNCDIADRVVVDTETSEQIESPALEEAPVITDPVESNPEPVTTPDSNDTSSDDLWSC
jgi:hypothetical protein